MIPLRRRQLALMLLLALSVSTASCDKNRIREAAKASDRMATLIGSMIDAKRQLGTAGVISREEELALTNHLLTANTKVKQFNDFARTLKEDTEATRLSLASAFNEVTIAIGNLSGEAIFPIKNGEAKKRLLAILNSINSSIIIIDAALKG